jgi:hypothetical protein
MKAKIKADIRLATEYDNTGYLASITANTSICHFIKHIQDINVISQKLLIFLPSF